MSDYVGRQIQKGDSRVGDSSRQWEIGLPSLEVIHERRPQHYLVPAPGGPAARHGQQVEDLIEYSDRKENIEINLNDQEVIFGNKRIKFDIDSFKKKCLLNGIDDIALSLEKLKKISLFEDKYKKRRPWIS